MGVPVVGVPLNDFNLGSRFHRSMTPWVVLEYGMEGGFFPE